MFNRLNNCRMKKRYILLICIGTVIFLIAVAIMVMTLTDNAKYNVSGNISSVSVSSSSGGLQGSEYKSRVITERKEIDVLLNCLKKVKINNQHRIKNIQTAPHFYEITFMFESGKTKTYEYVVYPATKCNNPFEDYYNIFKQTEAE